jgi:hypothetical protein
MLEYATTTNAAATPVASALLSLAATDVSWVHARVQATSSTRALYENVLFCVRRNAGGLPTIHKKELDRYEPEGKTKWDLNLVAVSPDTVQMAVTGESSTIVNWAIATRIVKS